MARRNIPLTSSDGDDDILGMLGKPVDEIARASYPKAKKHSLGAGADAPSTSGHPQARAVAELVDMGFPPEKARQALEQTETGLDTQAAVSWLLTRAHEEAKSKVKQKEFAGASTGSSPSRSHRARESGTGAADAPAWMRQSTQTERADKQAPSDGPKDAGRYAAQFGSSLFKSANTLWKSGQKQAQKALAEYQQGDSSSDSSQPKWLRDAELRGNGDRQTRPKVKLQEATDEALMLESSRSAVPRRTAPDNIYESNDVVEPRPSSSRPLVDPTPFVDESGPASWSRPASQSSSRLAPQSVQRLNRQAIEDEGAKAYVSPARRRRPPATDSSGTAAVAQAEASLDIFSDMPTLPVQSGKSHEPSSARPPRRPAAPAPTRPKAPARPMPAISQIALSNSTRQRQLGSEAFKRGDYGEATSCYSAALLPLPPSYPLAIVLQCNRALTQLKTGDAKAAVVDADAVLTMIGPSRGEDETISLGAGESDKPMREFYGKALMRKAEALEHLEKWSEAASAWRKAVEANVGGAVSIASRDRCEKASGSQTPASAPATRPAPRKAPPARAAPRRQPSALASMTGGPQSSDAVDRLRASNAAAAQASDEAFALTDSVSARVDGWKGGKEGNLRTLLASLDTVLWPGANWTKVGMGDLVMTNRVKVTYMKAIARVHPDKVSLRKAKPRCNCTRSAIR